MAKNRFSEPELFLIGKWTDVEPLRQSLDTIEKKLKDVCAEVVEIVRKRHPELDYHINRPTYEGEGVLGIGRERWPRMYKSWPNGFYIGSFSLSHLTSDERERPLAYIWLKPPTRLGFDLPNAAKRLGREAKQFLPRDIFKRCEYQEGDSVCLLYDLPEPRDQLLAMLLKESSKEFVDCLVAHFDALAKFTPVIDELFQMTKNKVKG